MAKVYDKLVRDKIVDIMKSEDENPEYYVADDKEYEIRLKDKLLEEVKEFIEDGMVEEIADIMEVIESILEFKGISMDEIKKIQGNKNKKKGSFKRKIVLKRVE